MRNSISRGKAQQQKSRERMQHVVAILGWSVLKKTIHAKVLGKKKKKKIQTPNDANRGREKTTSLSREARPVYRKTPPNQAPSERKEPQNETTKRPADQSSMSLMNRMHEKLQKTQHKKATV